MRLAFSIADAAGSASSDRLARDAHTTPPKTCIPQSEDASSAVPVGATPLHDNGAVAHRHVRGLPERGTNVWWSALRSGVALFLFGAGPRPSQQPGYAERSASHPVVDVVFVLQPDPSLTRSSLSSPLRVSLLHRLRAIYRSRNLHSRSWSSNIRSACFATSYASTAARCSAPSRSCIDKWVGSIIFASAALTATM